ncbi:MAG: hypothetical protein ACP5OA_06205 [Candidatus Woesearchaeota archaeon]
MDSIRESTIIGGKEVTLVIIFDGEFSKLSELKADPKFMARYAEKDADYKEYDEKAYTWAEYAKDFRDFEKYQRHKGFSKDEDERKTELDLKFYNKIKELQQIPFKTFKNITMSIFKKILFYEIEHNKEHLEYKVKTILENNKPGYLTSDRLTIEIKLQHVIDRDFYFYYNYHASDIETACFYCSGLWFIQTIVAPFVFFDKIDFAYIERTLLHEFRHHLDFVNKWLVYDTKFEPIIRKFAKRKSMYGMLFLYKSLFNLREEGVADFSARINSDRYEYNMSGVKTYNNKLIELSNWKRENKSENFYEDIISTGNQTASGEYTMGRNMCITIAMYLAQKEKIPYTIIFPGNIAHSAYHFDGTVKKIINKKEVDFDIRLNDWLKQGQTLYIKDLNKTILDKTKELIGPAKHFHFLRIYEGACDELGITEDNRIMTSKRFHKILQDAIHNYDEIKKKRLEEQGFIYLDDKSEAAIIPPENE